MKILGKLFKSKEEKVNPVEMPFENENEILIGYCFLLCIVLALCIVFRVDVYVLFLRVLVLLLTNVVYFFLYVS